MLSTPPPPQSPDLNIIENIWDELNGRVRRTGAIPHVPTTLNQLRANILYEWNSLPHDPRNYVQRYVTSMRRLVNSAGDMPATKLT